MNHGVYHGISNEDYHASAGVSKSGLDAIARSPLHFYALHLDPARPPREEKPGQLEGIMAHCAILEPEQFQSRYVVGPDANRNTKVWKQFEDENQGRICIKPDQYETVMRQAESVRKLPDVASALSSGHAEVSAYWEDRETGVLCRCRPDWVYDVGSPGVILLDVKTCGDASTSEFARQVARKRYHVQNAFYSDGYREASGRPVLGFIFVAVESEWPYAASATMLDDDSIKAGRDLYRINLNTYAECLRRNEWPGYSESIELMRLPNWALSN